MEQEKMPIPLRPTEPSMPMRPRRRVPLPAQAVIASDASVAALERIPLRTIRRDPDLAVAPERPADHDGWPCLPLTER